MKQISLAGSIAITLLAASLAFAKGVSVTLNPTKGNTAKGTISFSQKGDKVRLKGKLTGVPAGKHGFHIHEKGDCSAPDGASAGGHFNPGMKPHGAPTAAEHHVGDLGNIEANSKGEAKIDMTVGFLSLSGDNSIVGKGMILHGGVDDFTTQPTGNVGARIACGIIQ